MTDRKITLPTTEPVRNGRWKEGKVLSAAFDVYVLHKGEFAHPIRARCWISHRSTSGRVWAAIWTHHADGRYWSGSGNASGYGYDRDGASLSAALRSAGFDAPYLFESGQYRDDFEALTRALGFRGKVQVSEVQG